MMMHGKHQDILNGAQYDQTCAKGDFCREIEGRGSFLANLSLNLLGALDRIGVV
jgi:hypothetical protein